MKKISLLIALTFAMFSCVNSKTDDNNKEPLKDINTSNFINNPNDTKQNINKENNISNNNQKINKMEKLTEKLTAQSFKDKIFNYEINKEWKYEGELPCIIDFYADWCGPCKMIAPILEELAKEYDGKIKIYKVDTEREQELAAVFGIRSIPSILFIPKDGQPQMLAGALPKANFVQVINDVLLNPKKQ